MDILILGAGNVGRAIAYDLVHRFGINTIMVIDRDQSRLDYLSRLVGDRGVETNVYNLSDGNVVRLVSRYDVVVNALPGRFGPLVLEAAIDAGVDLVDVSYMPLDIFEWRGRIEEAGITVIPDAGFAPGLSNILVGHAVAMFDEVEAVNIYVGGIPSEPVPPLDYLITWSVEDLIEEYMRRPRIVEDGRVVVVDALSGLENIEFPGVGVLEAFYTDGLRTLLYTIKGVRSMWEKTLRYPGHVEKIRLLRDIGLFSDEPVCGVAPRRLLVKLLSDRLVYRDIDDLVVMRIDVTGVSRGERKIVRYTLLESGVDEVGFIAMARVTGYTASILTQLVFDDLIEMSGLVPPELIGSDNNLYRYIIGGLGRREIEVGFEEVCLE